LIPKIDFDLGVLGDGLIVSLLLLFRKKKTIPTNRIPKNLGTYLIVTSFITLFIVRAFANITSLLMWEEAVGFCASVFVIGYLVRENE